MMKALVSLCIIAAVFFLMPSSTMAQSLGDKTPCTVAADAFDRENLPAVRDVSTYVENVLEQLDAAHTNNGEPGIVAGLNDKGMSGLVAVTITYCRQHPKSTIYNQAALVYRGIRAAQLQLGTAK